MWRLQQLWMSSYKNLTRHSHTESRYISLTGISTLYFLLFILKNWLEITKLTIDWFRERPLSWLRCDCCFVISSSLGVLLSWFISEPLTLGFFFCWIKVWGFVVSCCVSFIHFYFQIFNYHTFIHSQECLHKRCGVRKNPVSLEKKHLYSTFYFRIRVNFHTINVNTDWSVLNRTTLDDLMWFYIQIKLWCWNQSNFYKSDRNSNRS